MPRIRSSLSNNDKMLNAGGDNATPVKIKSRPDWHYCYVCEDWFFIPTEDYRSLGHYDLHRLQELAGKSDYHRIEFGPLLKQRPQRRVVKVGS